MKISIIIDKILSYQTLVYKNGARTYKKKEYHNYMRDLYAFGLHNIDAKDTYSSRDLSIKIDFFYHDKRVGDLDNITKPILDTLQNYCIIKDDKYVNQLSIEKIYCKGEKKDLIEIEIMTNDC